ncbi:MAG: hypothetical protein Q9187_006333, partial [Circinaria calcarea]
MAKQSLNGWRHQLQNQIDPADNEWAYTVPALPKPSVLNLQRLLKFVAVTSNASNQCIDLRLSGAPINRALANDALDRFLSVSFNDFHLYYPPSATQSNKVQGVEGNPQRAPPKESADYVVRLLRSGISLNGVQYHFYGHGNSQLKSKTCFLFAGSKNEISRKIESLGDFARIKTVAKKAKRIGLLFSTAEFAIELQPDRCEDIPDVVSKDYVFTDGCGLISRHLANLLAQKARIQFRNKSYLPSVFQIRYRGYKGVLTLDPTLRGQVLARFRDSMKKFKGGTDLSLSVIDYSKPYSFGYLNDEVVLLLHSLGISELVLLRKQREHYDMLAGVHDSPQHAFRFLTYCNRLDLAEKVVLDGAESIQSRINKLLDQEYDKMLNKRDDQRCRIMIPRSRLLFGVCDPRDVLKEGECAVRVTMDGDGQPRQLTGMEILVTRNPCLHPGDLQKFKAVERPELAHLVDCIVFPTWGKRPSADLMSGGDLDGDTSHYASAKEPVTFKPISDDDRLVYFARYTNASLGRVKNLYLKWARLKGSMSTECQELNHLFSKCVDGNRIKVPEHLENLPQVPDDNSKFILDILHDAAKEVINSRQKNLRSCDGYSYSAMQRLLSRDDLAMSEFALIKVAYRWCLNNNASLGTFLEFFDMNNLRDEEKAWVVAQLPPTMEMPSLVLNALTHSSFISESELFPFKLHYPGLRWKRIFDSNQDRMARFLHVTAQSLELFDKKLLVLRTDNRLTVAIYVPRKIEKRQECQVDDTVRLFAFPHTQGTESFQRRAVPTKANYRLYCDDNVLQLYEGKRANTWIWLARPGSDDTTYRNQENEGHRRRERQATIMRGENYDCVASIALDTEKVVPLFEKEARIYTVPALSNTDWSTVSVNLRAIARDGNFASFKTFKSVDQCDEVFNWLLERDEKGLILRIYDYLLENIKENSGLVSHSALLRTMLAFTRKAPFLSISFTRIEDWGSLGLDVQSSLIEQAPSLLEALILAANTMEEIAVDSFKKILAKLPVLALKCLGTLCKTIALTVNAPELALELLLGTLEPASSRLLLGRPKVNQHYLRSLTGIALEHIDEATQSRHPAPGLIDLKKTGKDGTVKGKLRIDSPISSLLKLQDHVRLTTASSPSNSQTLKMYSMDALIEASEPGRVIFRCLHPIPTFVEECSWQVQNCGSFVTSKTTIEALNRFTLEPDTSCKVHDQLLGLLEHGATVSVEAICYTERSDLNESQNAAIKVSLANPLTCLWGPPGTGKTHTIIALLQELLHDGVDRRILVTAPTHNAVDNVLRKYVSVKGSGQRNWIEPIRVRKVAEDLRNYTCDAMMGKDLNENFSARKKAQERLGHSRLVFTTCIGAGLGLLRYESFDTVVIDEASQQTEPASLVPLVKECTKAILVGDHLQLRATVQQHAVLQGFDVSLFERLYNQDSIGVCKVMLESQYRMHREICSFSSQVFYEGKLKTALADNARPLADSGFPWPNLPSDQHAKSRMVFVQCSTAEDIGRKSKSNKGQASICADICKRLITPPSDNPSVPGVPLITPSIAVLTPYTAQADLLKATLPSSVSISSIDGFQGREADV